MKIKKIILIGIIIPSILYSDRFIKYDEIIYDRKTELYWQSEPSNKKFNPKEAIEYCNNLYYGGEDNWRLPHIDELMSLVNYNKYGGSTIATDLIKIIDKDDDFSDWYISSTQYRVVSYSMGADAIDSDLEKHYVLCVRE